MTRFNNKATRRNISIERMIRLLISLAEYAAKHERTLATVRQRVLRGGFKTARKIGRNWVIDSDEPYEDGRVKSGKYVGIQRKRK